MEARASASERANPLTRRAFLKRSGGLLLGLYAAPAFASEKEIEVRSGSSIQEAVDRAPAGGTLRVEPGAYRETIIIDKPLKILSREGPRATIIQADPDRFRWKGVPTADRILGAFNVYKTADVLIDGFTVTNALEGIWLTTAEHALVRNCISHRNVDSGVYFWACSNSGMCRCTSFNNAVGLYQAKSGGIAISQSIFTGNRGGFAPHKGAEGVDLPGIGLLIGNNSAGGEVVGNRIFVNVAAGIRMNFSVSHMLIAGNEINSNQNGLILGGRGIRVQRNNILGNAKFGLKAQVNVDATENWWGDASGPSGVGPGMGDAISSEAVAFKPWLTEPVNIARLAECPERSR